MADRVQSVERALRLLEVISQSEQPPSVAEMAKSAGVNRATAWRLLNTLEFFDLIERDERNGTYKVGFGIWRLASGSVSESFIRNSRPILEKTVKKTGGTAFLEVASKGELLVLAECKSSNPIHVDLAGIKIPHHCGSVGKLFLATFEKSDLDKYLKKKLEKLTSFTIIDKNKLVKQINEARKTGVAFNYKEHQEEWCGITSAVRDKNNKDVAYLNITLPAFSISEKQLHSYSNLLIDAAKEISDQIK
jgi:DNA-binding IclR family transcriptional regulator